MGFEDQVLSLLGGQEAMPEIEDHVLPRCWCGEFKLFFPVGPSDESDNGWEGVWRCPLGHHQQ